MWPLATSQRSTRGSSRRRQAACHPSSLAGCRHPGRRPAGRCRPAPALVDRPRRGPRLPRQADQAPGLRPGQARPPARSRPRWLTESRSRPLTGELLARRPRVRPIGRERRPGDRSVYGGRPHFLRESQKYADLDTFVLIAADRHVMRRRFGPIIGPQTQPSPTPPRANPPMRIMHQLAARIGARLAGRAQCLPERAEVAPDAPWAFGLSSWPCPARALSFTTTAGSGEQQRR